MCAAPLHNQIPKSTIRNKPVMRKQYPSFGTSAMPLLHPPPYRPPIISLTGRNYYRITHQVQGYRTAKVLRNRKKRFRNFLGNQPLPRSLLTFNFQFFLKPK
ncbi:hypothetical protein V8G54_003108 [Vigna mungo]|uniref:Uncharacterized protein n=1 Tax=Vigna mungo TaxID=3915 RepID=A0AAQ3S9U6_VIGMU